jgi:hypothetical protein
MRRGDVHVKAGYDGEFGTISVFEPEERKKLAARSQKTLF